MNVYDIIAAASANSREMQTHYHEVIEALAQPVLQQVRARKAELRTEMPKIQEMGDAFSEARNAVAQHLNHTKKN